MRQLLSILALTTAIACSQQEATSSTSEYAHQMTYICIPPLHNTGEPVGEWSLRVIDYLESEGVPIASFRMEKEAMEQTDMIFCGTCHYDGDLLIIESSADLADLEQYDFVAY